MKFYEYHIISEYLHRLYLKSFSIYLFGFP
jgi:hypothetical protein